jgi:LCP family protein required for cell wall assembly
MKNRPRGRSGPEEGTPEYDWLYGQGNQGGRGAGPDDETRVVPAAGSGRPDQTRVMPVQPREQPSYDGGGRGGRDDPPPWRQPQAPPPPEPRTRRWRPRFRFAMVKWVLLLWLVLLIAVPLWAWTKVEKVDAEPDGDRPGGQPGTTYLLVGSDSRAGLSEEDRQDNNLGGDVGQRTDTIMLLHTGSGPNLLMSIPRDSLVDIPGHGVTKVNAAYAFGGPKLLVRTLENATGIRIDHYVEIGLGGFVNVVDAVGGIEICPTEAMKDPQANLDIKKGCQEADGQVALGYARSRKTSSLGDIDRAKHQREVVSAVGDKAVSPWSVLNPLRYYRLNAAMPDFFKVGEGTQPWDMARFAWAMTRVDGETGLTCGVPIRDLAVNWDEERSQRLFQLIADDETADVPKQLCTPSGLPPR